MQSAGPIDTCLHYNAAIKAFGSRKEVVFTSHLHAQDCLSTRHEAIELYETMLQNAVRPDSDTYVALFKATSMNGDVKSA